jgi:hypothetical protein
VFNVSCETWRLADDPKIVPPQVVRIVSGRTASDAADLARQAAEAHPRHGFHKPSASWWGADETHFHRYVVHVGRRGQTAAGVLLASGLLGVAAYAFSRRRPKRAKRGNREDTPPLAGR